MNPWEKLKKPDVYLKRQADDLILSVTGSALPSYDRCVGDALARQADAAADRIHIAARDSGGQWRKLTYAETYAAARSIGQSLIDRGLSTERPVLVLSENSIEFALLGLGAALVGVPFAPISAAYARPGQEYSKLAHLIETVRPGLVLVDNADRYRTVRELLDATGAEIVLADDRGADAGATDFSALTSRPPEPAVETAAAAVAPDDILKILFTSGSTGLSKGVINTHRMICANQAMVADTWPMFTERPPVLLDWLPWSHTFGGNFDFYTVLWNAGTFYIDAGKPAPGLIDVTVDNLRDVTPTVLLNVPAGFQLLIEKLEQDPELSARVFANLDFIFYAGAAMAESLQERINKAVKQAIGREIPLITAWGTTETAPLATAMNFPRSDSGNIGLPVRGVTVKLAPVEDKLELRVSGPNITPGYWRDAKATEAAFDDQGYFCSGDAVRLADPEDPAGGLIFDGRISENFKLSNATWVHVGRVRLGLISAAAPLVQDCVIAGQDKDEVGALVFPSLAACRALCPDRGQNTPMSELIADARVKSALAGGLKRMAEGGAGSTMRVARALLVADPPAIDAGEITDKGYINQRGVLGNRSDLVERLYSDHPDVVFPEP